MVRINYRQARPVATAIASKTAAKRKSVRKTRYEATLFNEFEQPETFSDISKINYKKIMQSNYLSFITSHPFSLPLVASFSSLVS